MQPIPAAVPPDTLDDLRARLRRTRWVDAVPDAAAARGVDRDSLVALVHWWADEFDWESHERRLRALPWTVAGRVEHPVRAIHQRAGADAATVVLLHGWPDSFLRFERVLPLLDDVDVVVPALPGFPYSASEGPAYTAEVADALDAALTDLGCDRYVVSGGDVGSSVAEHWASRHPDHVTALHLTDVPYRHIFTIDPEDLSDDERRYLADGRRWQMTEGGYGIMQSTKPNTLAVGLGDSPAGLAAWIVEKLTAWTDSSGVVGSVFTRDELCTWLTLYWTTGSIGTSFAPYVSQDAPPVERIEVPTVVSLFPRDLVSAPRVFGERFFDVVEWTQHPSGGHFAAWERPAEFVAGVRSAVAARA
jgi:pimeloyl-ACP methyl ester carboxylesterase